MRAVQILIQGKACALQSHFEAGKAEDTMADFAHMTSAGDMREDTQNGGYETHCLALSWEVEVEADVVAGCTGESTKVLKLAVDANGMVEASESEGHKCWEVQEGELEAREVALDTL